MYILIHSAFYTASLTTHTHTHFNPALTIQYLFQVVQGLCIKSEAEHYRRLLSEEGTFTRGTLYWQLVCVCVCVCVCAN